MALKPTIYKFVINLSDMDRNLYETLNLTVAQHPSESVERMMARVVAFCREYEPGFTLTRGVSSTEEPDIWAHDATGALTRWIEIGEPSSERLKKATRLCSHVVVFSINTKSDVWWSKNETEIRQQNITVHQLPWTELQTLAAATSRTNTLSVLITDRCCYVTVGDNSITINNQTLSEA